MKWNLKLYNRLMPSTPLQRLNEKIQLAAGSLANLKKEKERLEAEVSLMKEENRRARKLLREHQQLLSERMRMKTRLERLIKKLGEMKV